MAKQKSKPNTEFIVSILLLVLILLPAYLFFIRQMGLFNDDWYLMYTARAAGASYFDQLYSVDRPMRSVVHSVAYGLFGPNPLFYNLGGLLYRVLSAVFFLWILRILWPRLRRETLTIALLYLIYPGFLSQFNGIDYQPHLISLATAFLSIGLSTYAFFETHPFRRWLLIFSAILLGWFYVSLVEYHLSFEALRIGALYILVSRREKAQRSRTSKTLRFWLPYATIPIVFLIWNVFLFEGARNATNLSAQLVSFGDSPVLTSIGWLNKTVTSVVNATLSAWVVPIYQNSARLEDRTLLFGISLAVFVSALFWTLSQRLSEGSLEKKQTDWRLEAVGLGAWISLMGPLPVILANRQITFPEFSRFTLVPSAGVVMLAVACAYYFAPPNLRKTFLATLVALSVFTHFGNGALRAQESEVVRNFWWQVAWRVPQLEKGTTLVVRYPLASIEEDYFVWGPANLIYYPHKENPQEYLQPALYAALPNDTTVRKVLSETRQEFDNRRTIRTYANYRNILIITQPSLDSCVQIIDGSQPELSPRENSAFIAMAPFSEAARVLVNENERQPPASVFGPEPDRGWCYVYQKAALARQQEDWAEVRALAEQAYAEDWQPSDPIEWLPFIQAYALSQQSDRLNEISIAMGDNEFVRQQVCSITLEMPEITPHVREQLNGLFCFGE